MKCKTRTIHNIALVAAGVVARLFMGAECLAGEAVADDTDFSVKGAVSPEAIYARDAKFNGGLSFSIGPWGCWISRVVQTDK